VLQVVVESFYQFQQDSRLLTKSVVTSRTKRCARPELLLFSANSPSSLSRQIALFVEYTAQHPHQEPDIAYTLAVHREKLPHRAAALVQDGQVLETLSPTRAPTCPPGVVMVFSGQGAQWVGMGRELIESNPAFRQDIVDMDQVLQGLRSPPSWSLLGTSIHPTEW
jgi:acyl transferase domain-containing protein